MLASLSGKRSVALGVHKQYVVVETINAQQQVVLSPRRVDLGNFLSWSQQHLCSTDTVVLEATTNPWHLCDFGHLSHRCSSIVSELSLTQSDGVDQAGCHAACAVQLATEIMVDTFTLESGICTSALR